MEKIFKLDLRDIKAVKSFCDLYGGSYDTAIDDSKYFDFIFVKFVNDSIYVFAYINKGETDIKFTSQYTNELIGLDVYSDKKPNEPAIILNVDSILEKISERGIDSLTKFEKDFLDNSSK